MASEVDTISKLTAISKIDPNEFDVTITSLLVGLGAEKYLPIFRKHNIGQCTLSELCDEDLMKLGVDDPEMRQKIMEEVKSLPLYEETVGDEKAVPVNLGITEIVQALDESGRHLKRINLSLVANTQAVKQTKRISDCLLYKDKYASDIALSTISEMNNILNSMENALQSQLKEYLQENDSGKNKKLLVGAFGGAAIAILTLLFVRSLKHLQ